MFAGGRHHGAIRGGKESDRRHIIFSILHSSVLLNNNEAKGASFSHCVGNQSNAGTQFQSRAINSRVGPSIPDSDPDCNLIRRVRRTICVFTPENEKANTEIPLGIERGFL